jgi:predicted AlkP superfamily pyrophosphatase or phosphodiesterase
VLRPLARIARIAGLAAALLLAVAPAAARPIVILLSWDGVRHDYLDRGNLPALERMAREGARAEALVPAFPSNTFPAHVTLATGAPVERHGIVANHFLDAERGEFDYGNDAGFLEAEPLWVAAERQGVRAATFFWVGSETDWHGIGASHRRAPFDPDVPETEKVEQILAWLDLPETARPGLVMSWWHGADHAGHRFGPDSERTTAQLREQDAVLAKLLAGLDARRAWDRVTLLVVSDHGMSAVREGIDLGARLREAGVSARVLSGGGYALVYLRDAAQRDRALDAVRGVDGVEAWPSDAVPEELRFRRPSRTGDVVAVTTPPRMLSRATGSLDRWRRIRAFFDAPIGTHGYDPARVPEMNGILLALGRGVAAGTKLPRVRALDVAPTVARLLGIEPPLGVEGQPIPGVGAPAAAAAPTPKQ